MNKLFDKEVTTLRNPMIFAVRTKTIDLDAALTMLYMLIRTMAIVLLYVRSLLLTKFTKK